ncbi:MAG: tRNA wybutosine-synthesizing 3 family protein [Nanoarchaeota archaeon]|nr:tRNA wybutosine-synthesizing 3 family protein [Nanoarchaeota archaeon]
MAEDNFIQRKKDVLSKKDKSFAQEWDEKIKGLCEKINQNENYYTTSSCSGRTLLMIDQVKKGAGLFIWVNHNKTDLFQLKKVLSSFEGDELVKFKCEPPIIHVICKTLKDAEKLLEKGQKSGFKNSGVISLGRNIVVELHGTEKLEFPIFKNGEFLVDTPFLEIVTKKSNRKLEKGWKLIKNLKSII